MKKGGEALRAWPIWSSANARVAINGEMAEDIPQKIEHTLLGQVHDQPSSPYLLGFSLCYRALNARYGELSLDAYAVP